MKADLLAERRFIMNDNEIIRLMTEEPKIGQRAMFDEYYSYVYAVSINILRGYGTAQDVEECVIDTFTKVFRSISFENNPAIKPFIGTVAKNCALSMRRSLSTKNEWSCSLESEEVGSLSTGERLEENSEKKEMSQILLRQIKALGEPDSTIIMQKFFYELNSAQIGRLVGMTPTAVRMRCGRALKRLKTALVNIV
jgi:RNA polymerase sigma-70 factor (ECF subfamily)